MDQIPNKVAPASDEIELGSTVNLLTAQKNAKLLSGDSKSGNSFNSHQQSVVVDDEERAKQDKREEEEKEEQDSSALKTRGQIIDKLKREFNEDYLRTFNFEKA